MFKPIHLIEGQNLRFANLKWNLIMTNMIKIFGLNMQKFPFIVVWFRCQLKRPSGHLLCLLESQRKSMQFACPGICEGRTVCQQSYVDPARIQTRDLGFGCFRPARVFVCWKNLALPTGSNCPYLTLSYISFQIKNLRETDSTQSISMFYLLLVFLEGHF